MKEAQYVLRRRILLKQAGETTRPTWARQRRASKEPPFAGGTYVRWRGDTTHPRPASLRQPLEAALPGSRRKQLSEHEAQDVLRCRSPFEAGG